MDSTDYNITPEIGRAVIFGQDQDAIDAANLFNLHTNCELHATPKHNGYSENAKHTVIVMYIRTIPAQPNQSEMQIATVIGWLAHISEASQSEAIRRNNVWWSNRYNELTNRMQIKIDGLVNSIASGISFEDAIEEAKK